MSMSQLLNQEMLQEQCYDETVVLLDFTDGLQVKGHVLPKMRRLFPESRAIFLTETDNPEEDKKLFDYGAWVAEGNSISLCLADDIPIQGKSASGEGEAV